MCTTSKIATKNVAYSMFQKPQLEHVIEFIINDTNAGPVNSTYQNVFLPIIRRALLPKLLAGICTFPMKFQSSSKEHGYIPNENPILRPCVPSKVLPEDFPMPFNCLLYVKSIV